MMATSKGLTGLPSHCTLVFVIPYSIIRHPSSEWFDILMWDGEMAHWVEHLSGKLDNLGIIIGTCSEVKEESWLCKVIL